MDFDKLKEIWNRTESENPIDAERNLHRRIRAVTSTQWKFRRYFRTEMVIAILSILFFGAVAFFTPDLNIYFYKLFTIIVIGSVPLNIRLFLSLRRILGIDYSGQIKTNIINAKNHLKFTIRMYYMIVVLTLIALVAMSWFDEYFLGLPGNWKIAVMVYLGIFGVVSFYMINTFYGRRLKDLESMLDVID